MNSALKIFQNQINGMSLPSQWLVFFILVLVVFVSALTIPRLIVNLLRKVSINPTLIAIFIISFVTSIPELLSIILFPISSLDGDFVSGSVKSFSNIFGANFLSLMIICLLDLIFFRHFFFRKYSVNIKITVVLVMFFNLIFLLALVFPHSFLNFKIPYLNISIFFIILLFCYFTFLFVTYFKQKEERKEIHVHKSYFTYKYSTPAVLLAALGLIVVLSCAMLFLISLTNNFQKIYAIDDYSVGGVIFAIITSSPEIWSMIGMFWIGLGAASIGIIFGSHLINMILLVFLDIENGTNSFGDLSSPAMIFFVFAVLISSVIVFFRFNRVVNQKAISYYFLPFLIVLNFVLAWTQILVK